MTPADPRPEAASDPLPPPPVPGRARPQRDYALRRLRRSWLLRACGALAFLGYGGLLALLVAGRIPFGTAGMLALLSMASWFFLFWWYPVLERTVERPGIAESRRALGRGLELFAIGCVLVVHVLLAVIIVHVARG